MRPRHIVLARAPGRPHEWQACTLDDHGEILGDPLPRTELAHQLAACLEIARVEKCDVTISTRASDVALPPVVDPLGLVSHAPGSSVFVVAPEGHGTGFAAVLWRGPTGRLSSAGRSSRVVMKDMVGGLQRLIDGQGGPSDLKRHARIDREFLLRRNWSCADLVPSSFPAPTAPTPAPGAAEKWREWKEIERHRKQGQSIGPMLLDE